jgi:hypothetical protein
MLARFATLVLAALPLAATQSCAADNCFRAVKKHQTTATAFCGDYLAGSTAAPTPVATFGPTRISSACSCLATAIAPTNLVVNGGFETGSISPWIVSHPAGWSQVADNSQSSVNFPFKAYTGSKFLQLGHPGESDDHDTYTQSVSLTAGKTYAFEAFYSVLDLPFDACYFKASIGGQEVAQALIYASMGGGNPPRYWRLAGNYAATATGAKDLVIGQWCDYDSLGGVFGLDDVSLI